MPTEVSSISYWHIWPVKNSHNNLIEYVTSPLNKIPNFIKSEIPSVMTHHYYFRNHLEKYPHQCVTHNNL